MGEQQLKTDETVVKGNDLVSGSLKFFFLSVCRMHKENNFNRFESQKVKSRMDDMIKEEKKESHKVQIYSGQQVNEIKKISDRLESLSGANDELLRKINSLVEENSFLKSKMKTIDNVPVVKLVPKNPGKDAIIMSETEYRKLQDLKEKISAYEKLFENLQKEENYDDRLLLNYKERIEILKEKLRVLSSS
jgi:hypothetical protein